ncbi:hypothetical protein HMPREF9565_00682 [Cutibacterium acnes HL053PA2]|nr:hypothetical protein HMPREF9575_01638 [Cutibacterium acnes HL110PA1]EFS44368.1 hypothetical protein HMPREF9576_00297 [Cutibacterium acnes HL110PA2]EFS66833.1 hypothetical protein HMPREF9612_00734 [Cutibacterium acnes HL063PA2]EFS77269.1 hypothetical protein HMPREF9591_00694 [Cutibacterium acnes HL086PA1]EFT08044.1 hypothetical protein HMPREF9618_00910 [Cutibacterium acnes HL082PA1]EFT51098.1 hypothetical protein HMPREF9565_00682 [Cutibacterium acnes HL053PA2]EFT53540.1 hypothetical protein
MASTDILSPGVHRGETSHACQGVLAQHVFLDVWSLSVVNYRR